MSIPNPNPNQCETQMIDLSVIIDRCSFDNLHWGPDRHLANVGCSNLRYTNKDQSNNPYERLQWKRWTRADNKNVIHCYSKSNHTQRGYRKRMSKIWRESTKFNSTNQRLANQARRVLKKTWFSGL